MNYVYVLLSEKDGKFYTGATWDLRLRYKQHQDGEVVSTKNRLPVKLVYYEACLSEKDAFIREKYLKSGLGKRYLRNRLMNSLAR